MGDINLSGYKVAAQTVSFTGTQTLVSLADNEYTNLSDEIDNSTDKYAFVDLEFVASSAAFTGSDSGIEVFIVPSVDGTNYPNWTGNVTTDEQENDQYMRAFMRTSGANEAQRITAERVPLPNGKYKYGVRSRAGVGLAASGSTLKWRPHQVTAA